MSLLHFALSVLFEVLYTPPPWQQRSVYPLKSEVCLRIHWVPRNFTKKVPFWPMCCTFLRNASLNLQSYKRKDLIMFYFVLLSLDYPSDIKNECSKIKSMTIPSFHKLHKLCFHHCVSVSAEEEVHRRPPETRERPSQGAGPRRGGRGGGRATETKPELRAAQRHTQQWDRHTQIPQREMDLGLLHALERERVLEVLRRDKQLRAIEEDRIRWVHVASETLTLSCVCSVVLFGLMAQIALVYFVRSPMRNGMFLIINQGSLYVSFNRVSFLP